MASQSVKSQDYWQKRAQEIRRLRDQEIARFVQTRAQRVQDKFGQQKILEIIKKNVGELRTMVIQEEIDIIDLLDVFWTRALTIGLKLGALADIDLDGTLQLAEGLKRQLESTPKADRDSKLGLLFGVPISLKENLKLKGTYSTLGVTAFAEVKETSNSLLVDMVIKHGGVPFVKSNVPMMLKTTESVNNIYGRALNPWKLDRTAGGSSGGESSLIASFCSPAGYGGDIGGSIRTPCHYTGLWGIKPTIERVTIDAGRMISHTGKRFSNTCMVGVSGPMARTVDDIVRMFKVMVDEEVFQRDPQVYRLPFNDHLYLSSKKIKIGYIDSCTAFRASLPSRRAVHEVVALGSSIGIEFVPMSYDISDAFYYGCNAIAMGDFIGKLVQALRGEKPIEEYKLLLLKEKLPMWLIQLVAWYKNKDPIRFRKLVKCTVNKNMIHLTTSLRNVQLERFKVEEMMIRDGLEGILTPGGALPALKHTFASHLLGAATYPIFFNVLNFPTGSIPVTLVREDEQKYECGIDDEMTRYSKEVMNGSAGLPIGVQVGCPPYREELVLNIMRRLERVLPKTECPTQL